MGGGRCRQKDGGGAWVGFAGATSSRAAGAKVARQKRKIGILKVCFADCGRTDGTSGSVIIPKCASRRDASDDLIIFRVFSFERGEKKIKTAKLFFANNS